MKKILFILLGFLILPAMGQSLERLSADGEDPNGKKLMLGGYAQIDFNQPIEGGTFTNGKLDVHRMVLMLGYRFNDQISFMSEIEIEHASEIYLEQAYLNYRFRDWLQLRAGLLLVPMGIINENHEPPTFNGVERPSLDYYVVPTTWREIGIGFAGNLREVSLNYQLYVINGVLGYDGNPKLNGSSGFRSGRQKGISSVIGSPNVSGRIEYYGLAGLTLGLSGYGGKTQTSLNRGIASDDQLAIERRDSSVVNMTMAGFDARYQVHGFSLRGQFNYAVFGNSADYNAFTGSDLGSSMMGFYLEGAYDVFHSFESISHQLTPFVRYENYNTQNSVEEGLSVSDAYHREEIIAGLGWKPVSNVALKADYQLVRSKAESSFNGILNLGIGLMF